MKLLIVSFSRLESDPRIRRQIDLFRDEWEVVTVGYGPAPDGSSLHYEVPEQYPIWRYPRATMILRMYRRTYDGNQAIAWVRQNVPAGEYDAAIANDVDAAGIVTALAPRNGFHADLHEFAPLQNSELLRFRLFVAPFIRWQLRTFVAQAASTSTVGESIAERYHREFGIDPVVVMNAPALADLPVRPVADPIRIVHAGAALRNRRIEVLIDAVAATTSNVTLDLFLPPNDPGYLAELRERAAQTPRVRMLEPVPFDRLVETLNQYDVGIHVLASTNYNNTYAMPNKFFEYVQARLGLVIGPSPEMKRNLERYGIGGVAEGFDAASVTRVLDGLSREGVAAWKAASDRAAPELSAQAQVPGWKRAVDALGASRS
ncbi:glycosyltransferase family 1 protein [Microbacterium sp.]|uniref:glycosyltransferase family 1 protein n=1 Tax=Microbacterium sp. TaxID=51671 RepID=UPI00334049D4